MAVVEKKKSLRKEYVDEIIKADDKWEPVGHTPMPEFPDLRNWDRRLLKTYKPFYAPMCDMCCFCTYGKCDLTGDKRGACGIDISTQQARVDPVSVVVDGIGLRQDLQLQPLAAGGDWHIDRQLRADRTHDRRLHHGLTVHADDKLHTVLARRVQDRRSLKANRVGRQ